MKHEATARFQMLKIVGEIAKLNRDLEHALEQNKHVTKAHFDAVKLCPAEEQLEGLRWALEHDTTVQEMLAWMTAQRGESLT